MDDAAPSSPLFSFIVPATTEDATDCNDGRTARCFPAESTEATDDGKTGVEVDNDDAPDDGGLGLDSGGSGRDEGSRDRDWGAAVSVGGEPNARPSPLVGAAKFAYFSRRTRC